MSLYVCVCVFVSAQTFATHLRSLLYPLSRFVTFTFACTHTICTDCLSSPLTRLPILSNLRNFTCGPNFCKTNTEKKESRKTSKIIKTTLPNSKSCANNLMRKWNCLLFALNSHEAKKRNTSESVLHACCCCHNLCERKWKKHIAAEIQQTADNLFTFYYFMARMLLLSGHLLYFLGFRLPNFMCCYLSQYMNVYI